MGRSPHVWTEISVCRWAGVLVYARRLECGRVLWTGISVRPCGTGPRRGSGMPRSSNYRGAGVPRGGDAAGLNLVARAPDWGLSGAPGRALGMAWGARERAGGVLLLCGRRGCRGGIPGRPGIVPGRPGVLVWGPGSFPQLDHSPGRCLRSPLPLVASRRPRVPTASRKDGTYLAYTRQNTQKT